MNTAVYPNSHARSQDFTLVAQIEELKAPSFERPGDVGERRKLPRGVRPGSQCILAYLRSTEHFW